MKVDGWITTDSDSFQFMRKLDNERYEFKEFDKLNYNLFDELADFYQNNKQKFIKDYWNESQYWINDIINLKDYTKSQAWNHVSGYYEEDEFEDMWNQTGDWINDGKAIVAECIFEQESEMY